MEMTSKEIANRFNNADKTTGARKREIGLLAELNLCTKYDICHVLVEEGALGKDDKIIEWASESVDKDTARIAEQSEGISQLRAASPTRCQPGRSTEVWEDEQPTCEEVAEVCHHCKPEDCACKTTGAEGNKNDKDNTEDKNSYEQDVEHKSEEISEDAERLETDSAAKEAETAAVEKEPEKQKPNSLPDYVIEALLAKLEKIEDEMTAIDRKRRLLDEEYKRKEDDYRGVCRFLGMGVA